VSALSFSRLYPRLLFPGRSQWEPGVRSGREAAAVVDSVLPWTWLRAGRLVRESGAEAVLAAYWSPFLAPALGTVCRCARVPAVGIVHNASPHESMPFARTLTRWFLRSCRGVLALSAGVAEDIRGLGYDGPVEVTPHPAYDAPDVLPPKDVSRAALGLPASGPVLLFFGLVRAYKGVDVLVEAMPRILERRPDATLLVAGEWYADASGTRARIGQLGLEGRIRIEDRYVPDSELATVFAAADLLVQPYRSATQSGVLQLAASHGLPCVVTDVGGLAEPVRAYGAGVVVEPGNPEALADGVLDALDRPHRDRLAEGARSMADAHGWDRFCEALESLLSRIQA
jgi:glycosyltransferase involved in cell wall biosynthesis